MKKLEIKDIRLIYHTKTDEITAIDGLTFDCNDGEFVAIIGPSGCGKTTVLSLIAGLLKPSGGEIRLNGEEIKKCGDSLGYMLQKDQLFPWRTIEQNVFLPLEIQKKNTPEARQHAVELLDKYGWESSGRAIPPSSPAACGSAPRSSGRSPRIPTCSF